MLIQPNEVVDLDFWSGILEKKDKDPYANSPFLPLKQLSSKAKGAAFEKLVDQYLSWKGYNVSRAANSDYDRVIDGKRVEIKGSFLWGEGTHFRWQQIRPHQDYDIVCFLAIYPDRVELYGATKEVCKKHLEAQNDKGEWIYNQHGGKKVNSGTFCIDGFPQDFPWLTKLEDLL